MVGRDSERGLGAGQRRVVTDQDRTGLRDAWRLPADAGAGARSAPCPCPCRRRACRNRRAPTKARGSDRSDDRLPSTQIHGALLVVRGCDIRRCLRLSTRAAPIGSADRVVIPGAWPFAPDAPASSMSDVRVQITRRDGHSARHAQADAPRSARQSQGAAEPQGARLALARRARRRLRRHRHVAALRDEGVLRAGRTRTTRTPPIAGERARRAVAGVLVAADRRLRQVPRCSCCAPTTRARAARSRSPRSSSRSSSSNRGADRGPDPARAVRHRPALRRGRDHAGDLGAVGGRRPVGAEPEPRRTSSSRSRSRSSSACSWCSATAPARSARCSARSCCVWFIAIGSAGHPGIARAARACCSRVNPHYARRRSSLHHGVDGFLLLGSVVLCVTGGEALYADMGHFGKTPIRIAWSIGRVPGPAAQLLRPGRALPRAGRRRDHNPFYALVEGPLLIPMIVLATMAAVIASQALISGAFSLTHQAVQLGYLPRVTVVHTSRKHEGQIYIPEMNWLFMIACIALVLAFRTSSNLAAAYGIAVTGTMTITSYLFFLVCRRNWGWSLGASLALFIPLLIIDGAFFSSNVVKIARRRLVPARRSASACSSIMTTWWRGRDGAVEDDGDRAPSPTSCSSPTSPRHPPAARVGHRRVHDVGHRRHPERAAPPREAQQGAARAGRAALDRHRERPVRDRQLVAHRCASSGTASTACSRRSASCSSRTCRRSSRAARSTGLDTERVGHDLLPRPPDAADDRQERRSRAGARCCSRSSRATRGRRRRSSSCRRTASSSSACRSSSDSKAALSLAPVRPSGWWAAGCCASWEQVRARERGALS